jgi:two-component system, NarL family, response regulator NreC
MPGVRIVAYAVGMSDPDALDAAPDDETQITVVLADDHQIVRDGIRMVLEAEPDIEVVAEAGDVDAAGRYVLGHKPSVLVLDLSMPGGSSLELIPRALEVSPETAIIVLTMQREPAFARQALRSGARGYVVKHAAASELVEAIRVALDGGTYINPQLGARLAAEPPAPAAPPDGLTPREIEVLNLIALGYMNPEIAEKLVLSVRTVETHRANIQRKTNCHTRAELIGYALKHSLVDR